MKEWIKERKAWIIGYFSLLLFSVLFSYMKWNQLSFFLISCCINLFLIQILIETIKCLKIKFNKKELIIIGVAILFVYLFYSISLLTRNFVYYWDYSCYYNMQIETITRFDNGLFDGMKSLIGSTWGGEYGNFISFITQVFFTITNKTPNSFVSSFIFLFTPYLIISISILIKKLMEYFQIKKENIVFGLTVTTFIVFPVLHATAIYGQPDLFGLFFIFLIVALTINYKFENLEIIRLILIFFATYCLFITRRWYVYWIISYYICYALPIIYSAVKNKNYKILKIIFGYGIICILIFTMTLFPLLRNIILNDYSTHYIFYGGGFVNELRYQIQHLGLIMFIIVITGIIMGIMKKEYRRIIIFSIVQYFIIIILFTRIQTMGFHHSLLLLPSYLAILFVLITMMNENKNSIYINSIYIILLGINFICSIIGVKNILVSDAKLSVPFQEDYDEIGEVVNWLEENLDNENNAYMITHNDKYNPDKFRNYHMPNRTVEYHLPYGSSIIGVHKFPIELFDSTYVITTTPFEKMSVDEKYQKVFDTIKDEKFELVKDFDMKNGYHTLIYKRVIPVDKEEVERYEKELVEESKMFKELYQDILDNYKKKL